ncbi:hypothetical protein QP938_11950 [Porticoccaceae bacterium LTM1]|nr:hypothetical protein QP938_11950 [Porticoccaceae bacterium LTM1]
MPQARDQKGKKAGDSLTVELGQVIDFYDELVELTSLNHFIFEAFVNITSSPDSGVSPSISNGLDITCSWVRQRQSELQIKIQRLIQEGKRVHSDVSSLD